MLCGDFNARVGERPDYVLNDNLFVTDLLHDDYIVDSILNCRKNCDKQENEYGNFIVRFFVR